MEFEAQNVKPLLLVCIDGDTGFRFKYRAEVSMTNARPSPTNRQLGCLSPIRTRLDRLNRLNRLNTIVLVGGALFRTLAVPQYRGTHSKVLREHPPTPPTRNAPNYCTPTGGSPSLRLSL